MKVYVFLLVLLCIPVVWANNTTYTIESTTYDSEIKLVVTNTTIKLISENHTEEFPNAFPFNYTFEFDLTRDVNVSQFTFNTIDANDTLNVTLVCPEVQFNQSIFTGDLQDWLEDYVIENIEPKEEEINELDDELDYCRDQLQELRENSSVCFSNIGEARALEQACRINLADKDKDKGPWMFLSVLCLLLIALFLFLNYRNTNPYNKFGG